MTAQILSMKRHTERRGSPRIHGVGLCAVFSRQGDWAFDYSLELARRHGTRLNVFHFLESPYTLRRDVVFVDTARTVTAHVTSELIAEKDKEFRERYDDRLEDFADVGFRLCEGNDEWELRKCFKRGEYEVLVIGYQERGAKFGGRLTIEEFAAGFKAPVVLVGPDAPDSYRLNRPAVEFLTDLFIPDGKWSTIDG